MKSSNLRRLASAAFPARDALLARIGAPAVLAVLAGLVGLVGPAVAVHAGGQGEEPGQLEAEEIRTYEGKELSSIDDFIENSIRGPQKVDISKYRLSVKGLVDRPRSYRYRQVLKLPHYEKPLYLTCVEGWYVRLLWEGVRVADLLDQVGVKPEARVIIFRAYDGYSTSFPLEYIRENDVLMAFKMNGLTLPPERGYPFQLVADKKWGYKWIRWITEIELSDDATYRGYWESRGYSQDGSLDKPFYDEQE
jgi:DMSO/TMAO reductase YedYZ molybdopterin-dependent catalytic subunit